jgi:transcriptional regulator with XRE-family HTH domain
MPVKASPDGPTLGRYLDDARQRAGFSLRALAAITGYPMSRINRLLKDEVERPSPATLVQLADALNLSASGLFALAGHPYPDLDDVLRNDYGLPDQAIAKVHDVIRAYAAPEGKS